MNTITMTSTVRTLLVAAVFAVVLLSATFAYAQDTGDQQLRDTIRAAILSDQRSASMTPAEVEAMVDALTRQAQSVGMTAQDIVWRPTGDSAAQPQTSECSGFLCALNRAFGFDGSNYTIPIWLGASALMLIFLIAGILEYKHLHNKKMTQQAQSGPGMGDMMPPMQQ